MKLYLILFTNGIECGLAMFRISIIIFFPGEVDRIQGEIIMYATRFCKSEVESWGIKKYGLIRCGERI
jgi:hypothetical protein